MKPSTFAALVFIAIGVFGVWKIVQYKREADARRVPTIDASPPDAAR